MGNKCSSRYRACGTLAAVCAAILPVVADAQDTAIDRIDAIERQTGLSVINLPTLEEYFVDRIL